MHVHPPNSKHSTLHGGENDGNMIYTPTSHHDGGVNVLMCDGSVTFVSDSVDRRIWWAMGTRSGGELLRLE